MKIREILLLTLLVLLCGNAAALTPAATPPAQPGSPGFDGRRLSAASLSDFETLLPAEMVPLVRAGEFEMDVLDKPHFEWDLGSDWATASAANREAAAVRLEDGAIISDGPLPRGFPFGSAEQLRSDSDYGRKILWSINALWWSQRVLSMKFELFRPAESRVEFSVQGSVSRLYPRVIDSKEKSQQLFRERIRFESPAFLNSLAWLTFRFMGVDEDVIWVYSPAIGKTRELTGSNRVDGLLRTSFSPDDLLVWSGKPALIDPIVDREFSGLVVVPYLDPQRVVSAEGCDLLKWPDMRSLSEERAGWNFQDGRFPHAAPWLPSTSTMVPRPLLRLELVSQDPFSIYGRQVLYIDAGTMLPAYKVVYDRAGRLWKLVIGGFAMADSADGKRRFPVNVFVIVHDLLRRTADIVETKQVLRCDDYQPELKLGDFDPGKLAPKTPEPKSTKVDNSPKRGAVEPPATVSRPTPPSQAQSDD